MFLYCTIQSLIFHYYNLFPFCLYLTSTCNIIGKLSLKSVCFIIIKDIFIWFSPTSPTIIFGFTPFLFLLGNDFLFHSVLFQYFFFNFSVVTVGDKSTTYNLFNNNSNFFFKSLWLLLLSSFSLSFTTKTFTADFVFCVFYQLGEVFWYYLSQRITYEWGFPAFQFTILFVNHKTHLFRIS